MPDCFGVFLLEEKKRLTERLCIKRTTSIPKMNCFWLGVSVDLLKLMQEEEELLFCGDVVNRGLFANNKIDYDPTEVTAWKPNQSIIKSSSHFEQQLQSLAFLFFHSVCESFCQVSSLTPPYLPLSLYHSTNCAKRSTNQILWNYVRTLP